MKPTLLLLALLALAGCRAPWAPDEPLFYCPADADGTLGLGPAKVAGNMVVPRLEIAGIITVAIQSEPPFFTYSIEPRAYLLAPITPEQRAAIADGRIVVTRDGKRLTPDQVQAMPFRATAPAPARTPVQPDIRSYFPPTTAPEMPARRVAMPTRCATCGD